MSFICSFVQLGLDARKSVFRGSVVVDSLFIVYTIVCGGSVCGYSVLCVLLVLQSSCCGRERERERERERAGCFTLTVFLMSCGSQCSVALPHGAEGWSAVCDCGIS